MKSVTWLKRIDVGYTGRRSGGSKEAQNYGEHFARLKKFVAHLLPSEKGKTKFKKF